MKTHWNFLLFAFPLAVLLGVIVDVTYTHPTDQQPQLYQPEGTE